MERKPNSALSRPSAPLTRNHKNYGKTPLSSTPHPAQATPRSNPKPSPSTPVKQSVTLVPLANHEAVPAPEPATITAESLLSGQLSEQTKRAYRSDLKAFFAYLGHSDVIDKPEAFITFLRSVDRQTVAKYRDQLLAEGKAATTIARRMTVLNTVFEILKEELV